MTITLKPLDQQVVVILGASSGIGRETALCFARKGAKVMVAARSEDALRSLVQEMRDVGAEADFMVCDAADAEQVKALAEKAASRFGRIDTWVNNAAVAVYALAQETTPEEFRRVMEVNYLGQVHGALAALPHLRKAGGGAIIGTSSVEGVVAMPLHSAYAASKHAVEGFMDALRRELMSEGAPISVTSIKPATINTPFFTNARNKMDVKPQGPAPVYQPIVVADCILYAAENPVRDLYAGGASRLMVAAQRAAPKLFDAVLARIGIPSFRSDEPAGDGTRGSVDAPLPGEHRRQGRFKGQARRSLYTWFETRPKAKAVAGIGAMAAGALLSARPSRQEHGWHDDAYSARRSGGSSFPLLVMLPLSYYAIRWLARQDEHLREAGHLEQTASGGPNGRQAGRSEPRAGAAQLGQGSQAQAGAAARQRVAEPEHSH